ncbi:MAG: DNA gyrase subunit A [Phycisphaerales bacterium]
MAETPDTTQSAGAPADRIVNIDIDRELHDSYLTYAMSTIMDRALPDVRDGLKPSQRRILVAMNDLNLSPGRKHIKCAKICGDTSGNYHPHGEGVIYPTLVNMGQVWKTRALLVDKQGNFGSIEGDPPAAMRYTEARMTAAAVALLEDLDKDTVDHKPNYDDRLKEPTVLPARFPNLLVNGSSGIAVGMSSSMPPHNVGEICDAIVAVIDDPTIGLEELMRRVPGPDFPTGGVIVGRRGIVEAYATGRGRLTVRGRIHLEKEGTRDAIVIDQIPYQVVQSTLIEKIVEASRGDRIPDIADVKNHSGRDAQTRIVVVLKKNADPEVVEKQLYEFTPLQETYSVINIALVKGQPRTLPLRSLIDLYIEHRKEVVRRRTAFLLRQAKQQAHRLEGLIYAVCDIDEVIRIIRAARTREEAIEGLMARAFRIARDHRYAPHIPEQVIAGTEPDGARLTRVQAEAIGALRLIQLTGLEIEKLAAELSKLVDEIEGLEAILADERLVLDIIREDTIELKERFSDARRTVIEGAEAEDFEMADLIPEHEVVVSVSRRGYVKRLPVDTYRIQGRGGKGVIGAKAGGAEDESADSVESVFVCSSHDDLLCFTNTGRVFKNKVWQVPEAARTAKGRAIQNLLELRPEERICAWRPVARFEEREDYLFFLTANGQVKRTALQEYRNVNRGGIIALGLKEGDRLVDVLLTGGRDHVLLSTAQGMSIRFDENDARVMGRSAAGVIGIDLAEGDEVVGGVVCDDSSDLLTVCETGYGKRTPMREYLVQSEDGTTRVQSRGGKGRIDIRTEGRNGRVVAVRAVQATDSLLISTKNGKVVRIGCGDVRQVGRATQGVRLVSLDGSDTVASVAKVVQGDESAEPAAPPPADEGGDGAAK